MKRLGILIYTAVILSFGLGCHAQSQFSDTLTRVEKSLFGVDYNTQSDDARLKRIEKVVYGAPSSSPIQQRMNKISKDLSADLIGKEIKPKSDTFQDEEDEYKETVPKADANINYPAVDMLEKSVFSKDFKTIDIQQRLTKLEKKVFNKSYSDDLNTRVERLKVAISPQKLAQSEDSTEDYDSSYIPNRGDNDYSSVFSPSSGSLLGRRTIPEKSYDYSEDEVTGGASGYQADADIVVPLADLEKKVLKKSYPNDVVSNRLLRMELKVFNSTFTDDDEQTRLDRIASAYQAKKSAGRYDNNKFSQHAATAMQVGAFLLMILAAIL